MNVGSPSAKYRPLLLAALAVIALPFGLQLLGLSLNTGTMVVALAIAAMGLNLCVGYTGLVSFGHGTWFGIGAYAAGLIQRNWFGGDIFLPLLLAAVVVAIIATFVGFVILRRRGVYFSLLTLALSALTYTIAFRWTAVTGGEDGLGGLKRGSIGAFSLVARSAIQFTKQQISAGEGFFAIGMKSLEARNDRMGGAQRSFRAVPRISGHRLRARGLRPEHLCVRQRAPHPRVGRHR
jgi:ABC-type branched-subunit amino acid transport system permease subunit